MANMKLVPFLLLFVLWSPSIIVSGSRPETSCKAWLVQSIPTDMPLLPRVADVLSTGEVLKWMARNAKKRLDIIAQYWQFVPGNKNPESGDFGYSDEDMVRFGADEGRNVFMALEDAADRNVNLRILQHSGVYPNYANESAKLAAGRPNVENVTLISANWWGSGIVHTKAWISDDKDVYIGSANNDWKSLTQVKELGIYLTDCPVIAKKIKVYFNNLWKLSSLDPAEYTKLVWDEQWQAKRRVPCWSHFINKKERCESPLPEYMNVPHVRGYPVISDPSMLSVPLETPGPNSDTSSSYSSYLSFAPPELLFDTYQSDEQAWVETIKSVRYKGIVRINTMDWLGQSQYADQTIYWSSLSTAISEVVFSKSATVQLLVAHWAHFIVNTDQYLKSLLYTNTLCTSSKRNKCSGKVELKYYEVPGYNETGPAIVNGVATESKYPGLTRVNHGKYAVSDVRAHIGTSNLIWDYFYATAGASFGTYNPGIVAKLKEVFDADWNSPYAIPFAPESVMYE